MKQGKDSCGRRNVILMREGRSGPAARRQPREKPRSRLHAHHTTTTMQQVRPQTDAANHGSRTLTLNGTSADSDATLSTSAPGPSTSSAGVLRLRGRALNHAKVQWEDDVVDNEFLGRKKSKSELRTVAPATARSLTPSYPATSLLHLPQAQGVRRVVRGRVGLVMRLERQQERSGAPEAAYAPASAWSQSRSRLIGGRRCRGKWAASRPGRGLVDRGRAPADAARAERVRSPAEERQGKGCVSFALESP